MITDRNPMRNQVAVAGAATTGFVARNTERSQASLVAVSKYYDNAVCRPRRSTVSADRLPLPQSSRPSWAFRRSAGSPIRQSPS
jgi:hypothetical protein